MADTYTISLGDPRSFSDDEIAEGTAFGNELTAEVLPEQPPTPVDLAIASTRAIPARLKIWNFRARAADGSLAGSANLNIDPENDNNPDMFFVNVRVHASHRGHGLGSRLLAEAVKVARAERRTRLIGATNERVPSGEAFASALGAEAKAAGHMNRLLIADVDRALMERWVAEGPVRGEGYELISWDGPVRDEWLDDYIQTILVMNTAPRDDLEMNDFTLTADEVRERDGQLAATGTEQWTVVARRISDGAWAGFHDVYWHAFDEKVVEVGATGVDPAHRGHALGKWLKAVMTLRVMDERPQVVEIHTGNADSNDAMLGINKEMGYQHFIAERTWEISTDAAEAWLQRKGALPA